MVLFSVFSKSNNFIKNKICNLNKKSKSYQLLKKLSLNLNLTCVDVGCAGGFDPLFKSFPNRFNKFLWLWTKDEFKKFRKLKNLTKTYEINNIAIYDSSGQKTFFSNSTVSSLNERKDRELRFGEKFEEQLINCSTLFDCRRSKSIKNDIDILKIDTEGSEIRVLNGAGDLLDKEILCIKAEFAFDSRNGTNKFSEIDELLTNKGFKLMAITTNKSINGGLAGGDCLYFIDPSKKSNRKISEIQLKNLIISFSFDL